MAEEDENREEQEEGEHGEAHQDYDEYPPDTWELCTGYVMVRHHRPRTTLFVPPSYGPAVLGPDKFRNERQTHIWPVRPMGQTQVEYSDNWRLAGEADPGYGDWRGTTYLTFQGRSLPWDSSSNYTNTTSTDPDDDGESPEEEHDDDMPSTLEVIPEGDEEGSPDFMIRRAGGYYPPHDQAALEARSYLAVVDKAGAGGPRDWKKVREAGDKLLTAAGSVEEAAASLWAVREEEGRNNLAGVDNQKLDTILHPDMLAYLRSVRQDGMKARFTGERKRVEASLHPNAKRNLGQVYTQLWKDVCKHRALVVARGHKDLRSTISSPFEAVDKLLPDRTISPDKRIVHDQRGVNYYTDKTWHPPAAQPTHRQVAKRILMWKMRLPGVKVLLAKKDVAGAFRLLWVAPQDAELFAGDVPWEPKQMACLGEAEDEEDEEGEDMTIVYLVSSFGFSGSPGEWAIWGRATEEYHRAHRPAEPRRDLSYGFESKILVDDNILVEPWIGLRPWVSAENYEEGVRMMLGDAAVNADKDREEGTFRTQQTIWGLIMDTETEEVHLPERRVLKGAHLLAEEVFDAGRKDVTLRQLQILRGIATGWSVVVQGLKNELKAVDVFLGSVEPNGPVQPKVAAEANEEQRMKKEEQAWVDLWDLFETLRWLCSRSETWGTKFGGRLCDLLAPRERLACPGQWEEVVFVTTDATPHMVGAIDWTHGFATRETTKVVGPWVRMAVEEDEEMQIHIAEFLSLVAFACEVAHRWAGRMVLFGGDNQLVRSWVTTRRSKVKACRLLIRVLNMIEMRYNCLVVGGWLRTYHNEDADYITRCTDKEFEEYLKSRGYQRVQLQGSIRQALLDLERFGPCFLSWGEDEDRTEILP